MMFLNLRSLFSTWDHSIGLGSFQTRGAKKIPKTVLKNFNLFFSFKIDQHSKIAGWFFFF
jgi:hypothetical protein